MTADGRSVCPSADLLPRLESLRLRIDDVRVTTTCVRRRDFPGGLRPTSTIELSGNAQAGRGEHVGWTVADHEAFRERTHSLARGAFTVGEWAATLRDLPPYDRAALEAAAIDLALRQHGASLFDLAGRPARPVRFVVSFARTGDPLAEASRFPDVELKIDVDPSWPEPTWQRLAALARVAVLDFKLDGERASLERALRWLPRAWIEDPPAIATPPGLAARWSADAPVTSVAALDALVPAPAAVNVKAPRLGGVLEAIACLERCRERSIPAYLGGMFECGVGRAQSLALASLFTPEGPNDIAPIVAATSRTKLRPDERSAGFA